MSLINQMLQDLDKRRSDSQAGATVYGQIKSAPQRHAIHPAWWFVIGLALMSAAAAAWLVLRPSAPAMRAAAPTTQVSVKPDALPIMPQPNLRQPIDQNIGDPTATEPPFKADPPRPAINPSGPIVNSDFQLKLDNQLSPDSLLKETLRASPVTEATTRAGESTQQVSPPTKLAIVKPASSREAPSTSEATVNINKQVKELTVPQRAENEYRQAVALMRQGKGEAAIAGIEQALRLDPQNGAARQTLVALLLESKRHDEAAAKLREGLTLDPSQVGLAMILARIQVDNEKGETRPALETLQRSLPYAVERADYQAFLAALLQREGRHQEAIEHYGLAVRKTPQNGVWWMGLGISLQAENRLPEARDAFTRAKASNTLSAPLLAFVDQKLGQLR